MTASSMWDTDRAPYYGRLNMLRGNGHRGAWSSKYDAIGQWLQVDLGTVFDVTKVATQGRAGMNEWVTGYSIAYSYSLSAWQFYRDGVALRGNRDRNTMVENFLSPIIRARYIRIYPRTWYGHISMRLEVFGCLSKPVKEPFCHPSRGLPTKVIIGIVLGSFAIITLVFGVFRYLKRGRSVARSLYENQENSKFELESPSDKWELRQEQLILLEEILGMGAFGKVHKARTINALDCGKPGSKTSKVYTTKVSFPVAVKMLQSSTDEEKDQFIREIELMKSVGSHPNIVNMIGCCITGQTEPLLLIVEFAAYGSLLNFLRDRRTAMSGQKQMCLEDERATSLNSSGEKCLTRIDTEEQGLTATDLLSFAWQSAKGMLYLSSKGVVHRDLAARNVLVGEGKVVKISDFGLARKLQENENIYNCKSRHKLPLKWMSPEAIYDMTFTTKSDVWAFGVLLWEIATLGGTPYPSMSNHEVYRYLKQGYRMEKPDMCSQELYNLMTLCWKETPEERPTFTCLQSELEKAITEMHMGSYINLTVLDPSSPYYKCNSSSSSNTSG